MAEKLMMTALSPTMEEGTIVKWRKKEGEAVSAGDVLCEVETDKAIMEYESMQSGTLLKIHVKEGVSAKVGQMIGILGTPGEEISALAEGREDEKTAVSDESKREASEAARAEPPSSSPAAGKAGNERITPAAPGKASVRSSPLARKLAEKHGIDWKQLAGTGPAGRVIQADVERAMQEIPAGGAAAEDREIPVSEKRRIIAERLSGSMFSAPHYYLTVSVRADGLVQARQNLNAQRETKVSLNAFLMKFTAETLRRHPMLNATWKGTTILQHGRIDLALAVAQEDGLITPVVRDCGRKGILQIDQELQGLIEKARKRTLLPEEYSNSTFTLTNLGNFEIEQFTAVINPPNSAILAVGQISRQPIADEQGQIHAASILKLTLSCDHRLVDGAAGGAFLRDLKHLIEYPASVWH